MNKKGWKLAGLLGGAFLMWTGSGVEVRAEETDTKEANYILEIKDWDNRTIADVAKFVNIREEASIESDIVGILPKGALAYIVDYCGEWIQIESGDVEGYIKTEFLLFDDAAKDLYYEVGDVKGVVNGSSVNIRKEASSEAKSLGKKNKGDTVQLLEKDGSWYKIQFNEDTTAYMHADYIDAAEAEAMTMEEYNRMSSAASSATTREIDMLAAIIECEAGGESYTGQVAVGAVVLNRVRSGRFPNDIESVIKQRGQFTPVASGKFARVLSRGAKDSCYQAAMDALNGSNPVGNALFFNTGRGRGFRLGNHQFY